MAPPRLQSDPLMCTSQTSIDLDDGGGGGGGDEDTEPASSDTRAGCRDAGETQWQALGMLEGMRAGSPGPDWGPRPSTVDLPRMSPPAAQSLAGNRRQAHSHSMTFMRITQPEPTQEELGTSPQRCVTAAQEMQGSKVLSTSFHGQRATPGLRYSSVETRSESTVRHSTTTTAAAAALAHSSAASARHNTHNGGGHNGGGGSGGGDGATTATTATTAPAVVRTSGGGEHCEGMVSMVGVPERDRARNAILMRRGGTRLASKLLRPGTAPVPQVAKSAKVPKFSQSQSYVYAPVFPYTAQRAPSGIGGGGARQAMGAYTTVRSVKVTTTALNGRRMHRL